MIIINEVDKRNIKIDGEIYPTPVAAIGVENDGITVRLYSNDIYIRAVDFKEFFIEYLDGSSLDLSTSTRNYAIQKINDLGNIKSTADGSYTKEEVDAIIAALQQSDSSTNYKNVVGSYLETERDEAYPPSTLLEGQSQFLGSREYVLQKPIIRRRIGGVTKTTNVLPNDIVTVIDGDKTAMYRVTENYILDHAVEDPTEYSMAVRKSNGSLRAKIDTSSPDSVVTEERLGQSLADLVFDKYLTVVEQSFQLPIGAKAKTVRINNEYQYKKTTANSSEVNTWEQSGRNVVLTQDTWIGAYIYIVYTF